MLDLAMEDVTLELMRTEVKFASVEEALWTRLNYALHGARLNQWKRLDVQLSDEFPAPTAEKFRNRFLEAGFNCDILAAGCTPPNNPNGQRATSNCLRVAWVDYPEPPPPAPVEEPEEQPETTMESVD